MKSGNTRTESENKERKLHWRCHTPNLLNEILCNHQTQILRRPLQIFGELLAEVAERAIELNDPKLNALMIRLTLYDSADPDNEMYKETMEYLAEVEK